jgi:hypothetical protein
MISCGGSRHGQDVVDVVDAAIAEYDVDVRGGALGQGARV